MSTLTDYQRCRKRILYVANHYGVSAVTCQGGSRLKAALRRQGYRIDRCDPAAPNCLEVSWPPYNRPNLVAAEDVDKVFVACRKYAKPLND